MSGTGITSKEQEILAACWSTEPSVREDGTLACAMAAVTRLLADAVTSDVGSPDSCQAILQILITSLNAERAFLFEALPSPGSGGFRLGEALATSDLDGEPIHQPEKRVPQELLTQVAGSLEPVVGEVGSGDSGQAASAGLARAHGQNLALPVSNESDAPAVLYIENRFQPLDLTRETVHVARLCSSLLGVLLAWGKVRSQNESLWTDVTRLREQKTGESPSMPLLPASARDSSRHPKRSELDGDYSAIIGSSPRMLEIFQILDRISNSNAPVLINGESGTGKELIAHAVHQNSPRRDKVFVSENCGALTETLLESELFGYVKGAFTGATKDHKGLFELAEEGTLFLDEVGDMSPSMQKKLLRVLQEGVVRRVGGKDYIPVDVRVISATNKDLMGEVQTGNFREDLYYRLNVINLRLPPLRERKDDIPELVENFLAELSEQAGEKKEVEQAAMQRLMQYSWPGNVRELRNEIKRFFALAEGDIRVQDLSETILAGDSRDMPFHLLERDLSHLTLKEATERLEKEMIRNAIIQSRGNKSLVAKMLQVPKTSLYNKINKYGLDRM